MFSVGALLLRNNWSLSHLTFNYNIDFWIAILMVCLSSINTNVLCRNKLIYFHHWKKNTQKPTPHGTTSTAVRPLLPSPLSKNAFLFCWVFFVCCCCFALFFIPGVIVHLPSSLHFADSSLWAFAKVCVLISDTHYWCISEEGLEKVSVIPLDPHRQTQVLKYH